MNQKRLVLKLSNEFSNCAEVASPPKKKKRRNEEESNSFSSSLDESVVRICFPGIDCCCTQNKRVASRVIIFVRVQ